MAKKGNAEWVKVLIDAGANVNVPDEKMMADGHLEEWTPLMSTVAEDHLEVVQMLVEAGADLEKQTKVYHQKSTCCPLILIITNITLLSCAATTHLAVPLGRKNGA